MRPGIPLCSIPKEIKVYWKMKRANIGDASSWFQVLQTEQHAQTAVMTLAPGQATGPRPEAHSRSDQVLLVVEGEVRGTVGGRRIKLKAGDFVIVASGTPHRFINRSDYPVVTFNVYSPPEYAPDEKG